MQQTMILPAEIETYLQGLKIGQGRHAGSSFCVLPWQSDFLRGAFGQDDDAALSMARGCGKTTFLAGIMASAIDVDGPLVQPMADCVMVASSFDQGCISFRHLLHFMQPSIQKYPGRFRIQDSANRATIQDRKTGARAVVLGSDARRMHGIAPKLLLLDEISQWPVTSLDAAISALKTSQWKDPRGEQGIMDRDAARKSESHPFAKRLKGIGVGYFSVFAAERIRRSF